MRQPWISHRLSRAALGKAIMLSRRKSLTLMFSATVAAWPGASADAQRVVHIERGSPERTAILEVVRASLERRLGIKVIFVVERLAVFGNWAYAGLHPRTEAGHRIDYRRTRYARDYHPDLDSDLVIVLLQRSGASWSIEQEAFLPTDVVWEEWMKDYGLPRRLFLDE
jgi:hypothetical protein